MGSGESINLNDAAWVTLTVAGVTQYNKNRAFTRSLLPNAVRGYCEGDVFAGSLWEIMQTFGPAMYHGGPVLFQDMLLHLGEPPKTEGS